MKALYGKTSGERGDVDSDEVFIRILPSMVELNKNFHIKKETNGNERRKSSCSSVVKTKYHLN